MALSDDILAMLAARVDVQELCQERVYEVPVPDEAKRPFLSMRPGETTREHTLDGADGLPMLSLAFGCWADQGKRSDAVRLADIVRAALESFQGPLGGRVVQNIRCDSEVPDYDETTRQFVISLDFTIWYQED